MTRIAWILVYTVIYILLAKEWWMFFFLPFTITIGSIQGAVVNWWAHRFGYVNYKMNNDSKNILPLDFLFWGEAYHNNHHRFPGRVNHSHKWFEFDAGYWTLRLMRKMRIIKLNVSI
jgi:stearoyl-CoA desaturase (delta-9 desaturase)